VNILVTGGSGFIGKKLVPRLLDEKHSVCVLVRPSSQIDGLSGATVITCRDEYESIESAVRAAKPDLVIHLATLYVATHDPSQIDSLIQSNIRFGTWLLEAISHTLCRKFINVGTRWQHRNDNQYEAVNFYAATKQAFCDILRYYAEAIPLVALTLELGDTYGPGDTRNKIVDILINSALSGKILELSPGEQLLDLTYVDDVAEALACAIVYVSTVQDRPYESFSVSSNAVLSLKEVGNLVEKTIGNPSTFHWGGRGYRPREAMKPFLYFDILPGWIPRVPAYVRLISYIKLRAGDDN